jgi:hypothetical protein
MSSIKAILMMCALATTVVATNVRFHNNCGGDVWLEKSALVVALKHPHFQCGWADMLNVGSGKTKQVPSWGIEPFFSGVYDAYDGSGRNLPKLPYASVESKMVQLRKENGIPEPGRTQGAMVDCSARYMNSDFFNATAYQDVYLCAPKSTGNMITVVNNCPMTVHVSVFGKVKKGNFVCSAADSLDIPAGKKARMPMRQFEKSYLATMLPNDDPYTPHEKSVFFGKKQLAKLPLTQVSRGSHYVDGECDDPSGNKYVQVVSSSSKYATYSLCRPI